jgi:hypothetical protein
MAKITSSPRSIAFLVDTNQPPVRPYLISVAAPSSSTARNSVLLPDVGMFLLPAKQQQQQQQQQ